MTTYEPPSTQMQQMPASFSSWITLQHDSSTFKQTHLPSIFPPRHCGHWQKKPQILQQQAWHTMTSSMGVSLRSAAFFSSWLTTSEGGGTSFRSRILAQHAVLGYTAKPGNKVHMQGTSIVEGIAHLSSIQQHWVVAAMQVVGFTRKQPPSEHMNILPSSFLRSSIREQQRQSCLMHKHS